MIYKNHHYLKFIHTLLMFTYCSYDVDCPLSPCPFQCIHFCFKHNSNSLLLFIFCTHIVKNFIIKYFLLCIGIYTNLMSMTNCQSDRYFLVLNVTNFTFFEKKGIYITSLLFKSKKDIRKFPF